MFHFTPVGNSRFRGQNSSDSETTVFMPMGFLPGFTAILAPFLAASLAFWGNLKLLVFFNSLAFFLFALFFAGRFLSGKSFYLPGGYRFFFAAVFLSAVSAAVSPVRGLIGLEYSRFLASALLFLVFLNVERTYLEKAVKVVYFIFSLMFLVALHQFFFGGIREVNSTFNNANSMAFFCLLGLGFALENKNYYMAALVLAMLFMTASAGGLLALLAVASWYFLKTRFSGALKKNKTAVLLVAALGVFVVSQVGHSSVSERLEWWKGALGMFADRPVTGWGSGAFSYVYPAFHKPGAGLSSIYAHNYYLEFLAENGVLAFALWTYFLYYLVSSSSGFYKYALAAVLLHGFVDFSMAQQSNLWFFFFLAGISARNRVEVAPAAGRRLLPVFLGLVLAAGLAKWAFLCYGSLDEERALKRSFALLAEKREEETLALLSEKIEKYPLSFDLNAVSSDILLNRALEKNDRKLFFRAAGNLEYLLIINPYYIPAYERLEKIYSSAGETEILKELAARKKAHIKWN